MGLCARSNDMLWWKGFTFGATDRRGTRRQHQSTRADAPRSVQGSGDCNIKNEELGSYLGMKILQHVEDYQRNLVIKNLRNRSSGSTGNAMTTQGIRAGRAQTGASTAVDATLRCIASVHL